MCAGHKTQRVGEAGKGRGKKEMYVLIFVKLYVIIKKIFEKINKQKH